MRLLTKTRLALAGGLLLTTIPGRADTVIFHDQTDGVSVTGPSSVPGTEDRFGATCQTTSTFEECQVALAAPPGEVLLQAPSFPIQVAEPGTQVYSDSVDSFIVDGFGRVLFTFHSDLDGVVHPCVDFILPGCTFTESTSPVTVGSIFWIALVGPGFTEDTIQIDSDVEASIVPEPGSLLLLGTGLLGVVGAARRKWLG